MIRHTSLRGEQLVAAVNELIKQASADGMATVAEPDNETSGAGTTSETGNAEEDSDQRVWTNRDGRTVELTFVSEQDGTVTLRRADGQEFKLPLNTFSEEDQRWVRKRTGRR